MQTILNRVSVLDGSFVHTCIIRRAARRRIDGPSDARPESLQARNLLRECRWWPDADPCAGTLAGALGRGGGGRTDGRPRGYRVLPADCALERVRRRYEQPGVEFRDSHLRRG